MATPEDDHHPTLEISINIIDSNNNKTDKDPLLSFQFKKTNYIKLKQKLSSIDWSVIYHPQPTNNDIDAAVSYFNNTLCSLFDDTVPKKSKQDDCSGPVWSTPQLKHLKNSKDRAFKKYKKFNNALHYTKYAVLRYDYQKLNSQCYTNYLIKVKSNLKYNSKAFYDFVNVKRKSTGYPSIMKLDKTDATNSLDISELFAAFFKSTYSTATYTRSDYPYSISSSLINLPLIDSENVLQHLQHIKVSFMSGPDNIPSCILRNCANELHLPLYYIFQMSFSAGYFPDIWKESFIIPHHKSGSKNDITNYRGIAKLSAVPKLFEQLITAQLSRSIQSLISHTQHGFLKGRSLLTNVMDFTVRTIDGFSSGLQTDVIYTDFSKAFDTVNHVLLIKKLNLLGFPNQLLYWIQSYLSNRSQRVIFKNSKSSIISVPSGIPQGSHLGPLLFILYINDLPKVISHSNILMYADDVKLFLSYNDVNSQLRLQSDITSLAEWCSTNLMKLNLKKCKAMSFSRKKMYPSSYSVNNNSLEMVNSFIDLGITMDCKLRFHTHINITINKAKGVLGFIKRWSKEFNDPYTTKLLYTSMVRPILEFGSILWTPYYETYIIQLESVQKQFLIFALRGLNWNPDVNLPPYEHRLKLIDLPTLKSRRVMLSITFLQNLINGGINSSFLLNLINFNIPTRPTRHFYPIRLSICKSNYTDNDPLRRVCKEYNEHFSILNITDSVQKVKRSILHSLNTIHSANNIL